MNLSKVIEKSLKMIEQYCHTHSCAKDCKLWKGVHGAYMSCPLGYPQNWHLEKIDLSQLKNANDTLDRFDLYDLFDEEDDEIKE